MSIVVNYGGAATLELGRQSGIAQGQAEAAKIDLQANQLLAQHIVGAASSVAQGITKYFDDQRKTQDEEKQRTFLQSQEDRRLQNNLDVANVRGNFLSDRTDTLESGRNSRAADALKQKGDYQGGMLDARNFDVNSKADLRAAQINNMPTDEERTAKMQNATDRTTNAANRNTLGAQKVDLQSQNLARLQDKAASDSALMAKRDQANQLSLDALDSAYSHNGTQPIVPDAYYISARAQIAHNKAWDASTVQHVQSMLSGGPSNSPPMNDLHYSGVAAYDPGTAMKIAQITDPAKQNTPTTDALKMQETLKQLPNAPMFKPDKGNVNYFTNLVNAQKAWEQFGPPSPIVDSLNQAVMQERVKRQTTLLPKVVDGLDSIDGMGDSANAAMRRQTFLISQGVSEDELMRYAEDEAARESQVGP